MVGSSKILTVSYGTFSCTLEGFDQPFETMKSIAEYFRDLAADDRFFGAEPPQPDAQMLHRIAEREVNRRVESRLETNGIVLRQTGDAVPASAKAQPVARSTAPTEDDAPFEVDVDDDSVAAKLSRIRSVVARARASRDADAALIVDDAPASHTLYSDQEDTTPEAGPDGGSPPEAISPKIGADAVEPAGIPDVNAEDPALSSRGAVPDLDAVQRNVQTAEGLVGPATDSAKLDDFAEQKHAAQKFETTEHVEQERAAQEAEAAERAEQERAAQEAEAAEHAEQERAAQEAEAAEHAEQDRATQEAEAAERAEQERAAQEAEAAEHADREAEVAEHFGPPEYASPPTPAPEMPIARVIRLKRADFMAALASETIEEIDFDEAPNDLLAEVEREDTSAAAEICTDKHPPSEPGAQSTSIARTLQDDLGGASEDGDFEFTDTATEQSPLPADTEEDDSLAEDIRGLIGNVSLDDHDNSDLAGELTGVERKTASLDTPEGESSDTNGTASRQEDTAQDDGAVSGDERSLNRLLNETNAKLSETEGSRRRSAIAHLKAAVAATKAEKLLKGGKSSPLEDESLNRYRDDLAKVVRPRRPISGGEAKSESGMRERPSDPTHRPAPLVLVSGQRIDSPRQSQTQPVVVRPRRVSATPAPGIAPCAADEDADTAMDATGFADFTAARGAEDLTDILESALAYAQEIEGRSEQTRPQILRRAASLRPDLAKSREQGLQSFGQLLRSGRIRKVGQGHFALANIENASESRATAQ